MTARSRPEIFPISHRLAEKAEQMWAYRFAMAHHGRWRTLPSSGEWKKREWALVRRAFDAGARWMLRPFQQVCGLDRGPTGKQYQKGWRETRARITSEDASLRESLGFAWHSGRVFLELWISSERFPK